MNSKLLITLLLMGMSISARANNSSRRMAITFDDLPYVAVERQDLPSARRATKEILRVLRAHRAPAVALQEQKPSAATPFPSGTGLTLEVTFLGGQPPAYLNVPGHETKPTGAWHALFGRRPGWRQPPGTLPVMAVNVVSRQHGDAVRVSVSVFTGVRFHQREEPVADYVIRENEEVAVDGLKNFGVEPFVVKVVRLTPTVADLPALTNNTQSLAVTQIEHDNDNHSALPSFQLSLRNLSDRDVIAIGVNVLADGRRHLSSVPQGCEGRPLIATGATYRQRVALATYSLPTEDGHAPQAPRHQEVVITAAVFADGSYEGDAREAAKMRAFFLGRKIQVAKIVALLEEVAGEAEREDGRVVLAKVKDRASLLSDRAEAGAVDRLLADFPALDRMDRARIVGAVEVTLNSVKRDLLREVEWFDSTSSRGSTGEAAVKAWVNASRERYAKWLSGL